MIRKSNLAKIVFVAAAIGFVSPAFAQMQLNKAPVAEPSSPLTLVACYGASCNGGGSAGYNHKLATDYRLKHHPKRHTQDHMSGTTK
jgi:hypothetical protein